MHTHIVSLFLPYTINFNNLPASRRQSPSPRRGVATLRTPAEREHVFLQGEPNVTSYFPHPHDPRSMGWSDPHVPEFGSNLFFNQPRSRAAPAPPDTILRYAQPPIEDRLPDDRPPQKPAHRRSIKSPRAASSERDWDSDWTVEPAVEGNGGLTNAVRAAINSGAMGDIFWVGTLGFPTDALDDVKKDEIHEKLESEYDALPVYVSDSDFDGHYVHYCKTILWPVFHYQIPDHPKSKAYEDHSWVYYVHLNQAFADKVVKNYKRGDIIWIHDYHLLLVPEMIRKKLPDAQIGFFMHAAFPSSEVFRCLSVRKELLLGMLGANLVAFQTREYAHHFLQTCSRLLIVEATSEGVQLDDHFVNVAWLAIGVDPRGLGIARKDDQVKAWIKVIEDRYKDKKIILGRDKLDNVRGVRQKLLAFELFLNKYPEWREKVVMIQVATSTTENSELAATVSDIVTRIDSMHSTLAHQPLVFLRQDIPFAQYLALLSASDALMITSLREGMNLTVHEFVYCQDGELSPKKHGPVILSEFTGSASVFGGHELSVNPWDYQKCAEAIKVALEMDPGEKLRRFTKMREVVMHHTGEYWCTGLVKSLAKVHEEHYQRDTMSIPRLSITQTTEKYKNSSQRLFILDYEGTLAPYGNPTSIILTSPQRVIDALSDLTADSRNRVYVMSGRTPEELERLFVRLPGVGIIAENGCFVRPVGSDEWLQFADQERMESWKPGVRQILQYYVDRIEGSAIEERHCSMVFRYDSVEDPEAAARHAGDAANHINDACEAQRVHAVPVNRAVIIEPTDWSKASAASHIFENICRGNGNGNGNGILTRSASNAGSAHGSEDQAAGPPSLTTLSEGPGTPRNTTATGTPIVDMSALAQPLAEAAVETTPSSSLPSQTSPLSQMASPPSQAMSPQSQATTMSSLPSQALSSSALGPAANTFASEGQSAAAAAAQTGAQPPAHPDMQPLAAVLESSPTSPAQVPQSPALSGAMSPAATASTSASASRPGLHRTGGASAAGGSGPDFLFVAGDDREDEVIFRWANKLGAKGEVPNVTTVCVGKRRNTEAMATLTQGTTGLLSVLQRLARASQVY
ncbi:glycosyltransferase family 20-domain-containing protein [Lineolata rhizophorae]|uniref:Glycosyltransferase family 20-domain-containing protein n=1 Tax=Lineolata rhizophorae TaxID=578093 RepID=A0A6A6NLA7_9PEZI|nr:glycosyltransferase family 20-domain-containing protein [Lineolata rhizophorae]